MDAPRPSNLNPPSPELRNSSYARTLLGELDHRYLKSAGVRWSRPGVDEVTLGRQMLCDTLPYT